MSLKIIYRSIDQISWTFQELQKHFCSAGLFYFDSFQQWSKMKILWIFLFFVPVIWLTVLIYDVKRVFEQI